MSGPGPTGWTSVATKALLTLLAVAVAAHIVWWVLQPLLPVLVVGIALLGLCKLALGWFRRGGW